MTTLTKKCIVCGKEFAKSVNCSRNEWKQRRFCSPSCVGRYFYRKTGVLDKYRFIEGYRHPKGSHFSSKTEFKKGLIPWNKGLAGTDYLSEEARKKMSVWGNKYGKGTPNWRGGTTKLGTCIRSLKAYRDWRTEVLERDKRSCRKCGIKNVFTEVDHINPFYKILKEKKIKTVKQAKQCKELWDIKNGRTLCIPCHRQTPSYLATQQK